MKKIVFLLMIVLSANAGWAGNVKVMKTKYAGADYDLMSGPYMTVNVRLLASHVAPEECACFVLVNNNRWDGENLTISKLSKLTKTMCFGEAELEAVPATKILEIPMSIILDQKRLTGRDTIFYMKTVVVDFTKKDIIAQSDMIRFNIDAQRTSEKMLESVGSVAGGLLGGFFGNGGGSSRGVKTCTSCGGTGVCHICKGTGVFYGKCSTCGGNKYCIQCGGSGEESKDLLELMQESREDNQTKGKGQKKQQQSEDDGFGSLLEDLFGF